MRAARLILLTVAVCALAAAVGTFAFAAASHDEPDLGPPVHVGSPGSTPAGTASADPTPGTGSSTGSGSAPGRGPSAGTGDDVDDDDDGGARPATTTPSRAGDDDDADDTDDDRDPGD